MRAHVPSGVHTFPYYHVHKTGSLHSQKNKSYQSGLFSYMSTVLYSGIKVSYTLPTLGGIVGVASRQACPRFFVITESTIRMH
jgi:hypothetical protein